MPPRSGITAATRPSSTLPTSALIARCTTMSAPRWPSHLLFISVMCMLYEVICGNIYIYTYTYLYVFERSGGQYVCMCFLPSFLRSRAPAVTRISESSYRRKQHFLNYTVTDGTARLHPRRITGFAVTDESRSKLVATPSEDETSTKFACSICELQLCVPGSCVCERGSKTVQLLVKGIALLQLCHLTMTEGITAGLVAMFTQDFPHPTRIGGEVLASYGT